MRILFLVLVALFLVSAATVVFASDLEKMQTQMFGVTAQLNENCTATIIRSDRDEKSGEVETLFLTAKHCVDKNSKRDMTMDIPVYQSNRIVKKERYIATLKGKYYRADLALVALKDKQTLFEKVALIAPGKAPLIMGERVWAVGYPLGLALTVTEGMFASRETLNFPEDGVEYFRATPDIAPGNSGGALYHRNAAGDYELIGVTTAEYRGYPFMALYTPLDVIRDYLKTAAPAVIGEEPKWAHGP